MRKLSFMFLYFILGIVIVLGFTRIRAGKELSLEECKQSYKHYYLKPFLKDVLECSFKEQCGTAQKLVIYNTQAKLVRCLCEDKEKNAATILKYYNAHLKTDRDEETVKNTEIICTEVQKEFTEFVE